MFPASAGAAGSGAVAVDGGAKLVVSSHVSAFATSLGGIEQVSRTMSSGAILTGGKKVRLRLGKRGDDQQRRAAVVGSGGVVGGSFGVVRRRADRVAGRGQRGRHDKGRRMSARHIGGHGERDSADPRRRDRLREQWWRSGATIGEQRGRVPSMVQQALPSSTAAASRPCIQRAGWRAAPRSIPTATRAMFAGGTASRTVLSGGAETVFAGGVASGATEDHGGVECAYGAASATIVDIGGQQTDKAGGLATGATINSHGNQNVFAGATATGTELSGGTEDRLSRCGGERHSRGPRRGRVRLRFGSLHHRRQRRPADRQEGRGGERRHDQFPRQPDRLLGWHGERDGAERRCRDRLRRWGGERNDRGRRRGRVRLSARQVPPSSTAAASRPSRRAGWRAAR